MKIHIVGANGSMGERYQAIFRHLNVAFTCSDVFTPQVEFERCINAASGIVIAAPTEKHFELIVSLAHLGAPILCEKPLSKDLEQLLHIKRLVDSGSINLTMMAQYRYLDDPLSRGDSSYSYFRHGSDSLKWDCIQIIGLARGRVFLEGASPLWKCTLNGKKLSIADMDMAYISAVKAWLASPGDDIARLIEWHQKVMEF